MLLPDVLLTDGVVRTIGRHLSVHGTVNEYATSSDCSSLKCAVVNVSFTNGKASLSRAKGYDNVSGKFNSEKNKFGDYTLADDVKILDTAGTASDDLAMYTRIYPQRLDGVTIKSSSVLYYSKNKAGEIDELILKDITGDAYKYGVITAADSTTHTYSIDIDGVLFSFLNKKTSSKRAGQSNLF